METAAQRQVPWEPVGGRGPFDDINPELPKKKPLLLQERGAEPDNDRGDSEETDSGGVRCGRRHRGAHSLPPRLLLPHLQGGALFLQLKGLREAPPPRQVEVEGGGARALWRAVFSGNRKEKKKKRGGTLPAERVKKDTANQRRATGDVINNHI